MPSALCEAGSGELCNHNLSIASLAQEIRPIVTQAHAVRTAGVE